MKYAVDLIRNPAGASLVCLLIGASLLLAAHSDLPTTSTAIFLPDILDSLATALITAGIFGFLFEWAGKHTLIREAVHSAVGQAKAVAFGINDVACAAQDISYGSSIEHSSELVVSARMSTHFLENHKDALIRRFSAGKKMAFVRMAQGTALQALPGNRSATVETFFHKLSLQPKALKKIKLLENTRTLNYNFVLIDDGIWIKMYWNSANAVTPPAFFVNKGSPLHRLFEADVRAIIAGSAEVKI